MSNLTNDNLMERAQEVIDYFEGTAVAKILRMHLEDKDLESLHYAVKEAEGEIFRQEFNPNE